MLTGPDRMSHVLLVMVTAPHGQIVLSQSPVTQTSQPKYCNALWYTGGPDLVLNTLFILIGKFGLQLKNKKIKGIQVNRQQARNTQQ